MPVTQYRLSCDSFKNNVCDGFTSFQQNAEFVDMTLAADGHLVKVHKSILALASPYIKSLLQSTSGEHPIIFLSNVSHEVLKYILTYVYTGEVSVEVNKIQSFMRVARDLRISGLFGMLIPNDGSKEFKERLHKDVREPRYEDNLKNTEIEIEETIANHSILIDSDGALEPSLANNDLPSTVLNKDILHNVVSNDVNAHAKLDFVPSEGIQNTETDFVHNGELLNNRGNGLYMTADGYQYKLEIQQIYKKDQDSNPITIEDVSDSAPELKQPSNNVNTIVTTDNSSNEHFGSFEDEFKKKINSSLHSSSILDPKAVTLQYTMSTRGALQLILNRYMYYCHHQSHGGLKRRWRCIDYRSKRCPAFIDTDNEVMISRKFGHSHSFHDEKIRKKMKKELVFSNLNILLEKHKEGNIKNDDPS